MGALRKLEVAFQETNDCRSSDETGMSRYLMFLIILQARPKLKGRAPPAVIDTLIKEAPSKADEVATISEVSFFSTHVFQSESIKLSAQT